MAEGGGGPWAPRAILDRIGYGPVIEPRNDGGYVAPDLTGVWATAPYLRNGSVPTLLEAEKRALVEYLKVL